MSINFPENNTITNISDILLQKSEKYQFYREILDEIQKDTVVNNVHDVPIAYVTPQREVIYANKKLCSIIGYLPEQVIGRSVDDFIYPNTHYPDWNHTLLPILSGSSKDIVRGKFIVKTAEEQPVFFDLLYLAYRDKHKLEFIKAIMNDVSIETIAKQKLVSEREKTENILKSGSLGYWSYDINNNYISWSGNYEAITGYKTEEMPTIATHFGTTIHPDDLTKIYLTWDKARNEEYRSGVEFRVKTKSGKYKWVLLKIISIEEDPHTNHQVINGIHIDIDGYKRASLKIREKERQIIQNEENLRKIYKSLPIGIIIYDSNGNYVESNDEFLHIFGLQSKKEVCKTNILDANLHVRSLIQHYDYSVDIGYDLKEKQVYENYMNAPHSPYVRYINIRIISLLDTEGYVHLDNTKLSESLEPKDKRESETGYLLVATDNTILRRSELDLRINELELKEKNTKLSQAKEKAQESDRLKSTFLANVSHEIRTPLNAIIGFSELIATSDDKNEKDIYFDIVKTNNEILLSLINDILDLSKIESGRIELKYAPVNIDKLCRDLTEAAKLRATEKEIEIIYQLPTHTIVKRENGENFVKQAIFLSDKHRLNQIYTNFINNAIKNTETGSITISYDLVEINDNREVVRAVTQTEVEEILYEPIKNDLLRVGKQQNHPKIMVACSVSDTGSGIPKEKLEEIFQRFTKLNDNNIGFGLGLAITKSLVEQMDGYIQVVSTVGKGSKFTAFLPYKVSDNKNENWYKVDVTNMEELHSVSQMASPLQVCPNDQNESTEAAVQGGANPGYQYKESYDIHHLKNDSFRENLEKINIKLPKGNIAEDSNMGDKMLDILVAEDIDFNYMLIKAIIGKKHNLVRAKTGLEAVELFGKQKFNLILMDMKMPEMDGIAATRLIREQDKEIPIIAVTAYAFDTDKQIALEAGCNTYIVKPVEPKALLSEIDKYAK